MYPTTCDPYTDAIMSIGMKALREALPVPDLELFLVKLRSEPFDYTEWRKDHLWAGMSAGEIIEQAAKNTKDYRPPKGVKII